MFRSFPNGLSELVEAVTKALPAQAVHLGSAVRAVARYTRREREDWVDGWKVETTDGLAYTGRAVIVTSPAYVTADLVEGVDHELARLCREIPYASSGTIALAFPRPSVAHPLHGSGFVVPRVERDRKSVV